MVKYLKALTLVAILAVSVFSNSYCVIAGRTVIGSTLKDHAAINNAVIAVNVLRKQRADRFLSSEQYTIRVKNIFVSLSRKGVIVK